MTPPLLPTSLFGSGEHEPKRIKVVFPEGMIEGRRAELLAAQRNAQQAVAKYGVDSPKKPNVELQDVYTGKTTPAESQSLPTYIFAEEKQGVPAYANHKAYIAALTAAREAALPAAAAKERTFDVKTADPESGNMPTAESQQQLAQKPAEQSAQGEQVNPYKHEASAMQYEGLAGDPAQGQNETTKDFALEKARQGVMDAIQEAAQNGLSQQDVELAG